MTRLAPTSATASGGLLLDRVGKCFGAIDVLYDINLDIRAGEFIVFVGPSGCGKSTLLRMIAGLEDVSFGTISIGGHDVTDAAPSARGIAMVFQTYALYPHLSVSENMGFALKMAGRPRTEVAAKVTAAAEVLHLTPLLDRRPAQLSGGQRQRVAIGRAIVRDPQVFLFDEPLSNLDAELRIDMRIEIAKLHRRLGNTMIYVTHDQTEAMTLADRIVVLRGGRIEQVGTPSEIYNDPDNLFVAGFIGAPKINVLKGEVRDSGLVIEGERLALPPGITGIANGEKISLAVRPHCLFPAGEGETGITIAVEFTEYLGDKTYLHGKTREGQTVVAEIAPGTSLAPGSRVTLGTFAEDAFLFREDGRRLRPSD
jgi:lactose/L-arabinose transport system ATP-binding protein